MASTNGCRSSAFLRWTLDYCRLIIFLIVLYVFVLASRERGGDGAFGGGLCLPGGADIAGASVSGCANVIAFSPETKTAIGESYIQSRLRSCIGRLFLTRTV